jgi:hypothetical protein
MSSSVGDDEFPLTCEEIRMLEHVEDFDDDLISIDQKELDHLDAIEQDYLTNSTSHYNPRVESSFTFHEPPSSEEDVSSPEGSPPSSSRINLNTVNVPNNKETDAPLPMEIRTCKPPKTDPKPQKKRRILPPSMTRKKSPKALPSLKFRGQTWFVIF